MSFDLKISNGDLIISNAGIIELVVDNAKLKQDIIKILLTKLGENKYHPAYGSEVGALKIGAVIDQQLLESDLESSAREAINKLIFLQRAQSKKQFLTPGERIVSLLDILIERDTIDPRMYNIVLSIQTGKLTVITEAITVKIL